MWSRGPMAVRFAVPSPLPVTPTRAPVPPVMTIVLKMAVLVTQVFGSKWLSALTGVAVWRRSPSAKLKTAWNWEPRGTWSRLLFSTRRR